MASSEDLRKRYYSLDNYAPPESLVLKAELQEGRQEAYRAEFISAIIFHQNRQRHSYCRCVNDPELAVWMPRSYFDGRTGLRLKDVLYVVSARLHTSIQSRVTIR